MAHGLDKHQMNFHLSRDKHMPPHKYQFVRLAFLPLMPFFHPKRCLSTLSVRGDYLSSSRIDRCVQKLPNIELCWKSLSPLSPASILIGETFAQGKMAILYLSIPTVFWTETVRLKYIQNILGLHLTSLFYTCQFFFSKMRENFSPHWTWVSNDLPTTSEDCRRYPKNSNDFRRLPKITGGIERTNVKPWR